MLKNGVGNPWKVQRGVGKQANLFFSGSLGSRLRASRDNEDNNNKSTWRRSERKRRVGASRDVPSGCGTGGLDLQLNLVPQAHKIMESVYLITVS